MRLYACDILSICKTCDYIFCCNFETGAFFAANAKLVLSLGFYENTLLLTHCYVTPCNFDKYISNKIPFVDSNGNHDVYYKAFMSGKAAKHLEPKP